MKILIFSLFLLLFVSCSDVVVNHYDNYQNAKEAGLFLKGWLPNFIPTSSNNIVTNNNLDINTSDGEFYFDMKEFSKFTTFLKNEKKIQNGFVVYSYTKNLSSWKFLINTKSGFVKYSLAKINHNS